MGRGTTPIEAAFLGRIPYGCDVNSLSKILLRPRLNPPSLSDVSRRLAEIDLAAKTEIRDDLSVFYHPQTLMRITNLRSYFMERAELGKIDYIDEWIRMVATNRLTGHSTGFFSVYTLPPNQALSIESQRRINKKLNQEPPYRDVLEIILRKSRSLLRNLEEHELNLLSQSRKNAKFATSSSDNTPEFENDSVQLIVTSPPFLDVVNYQKDNWLRCWFNGIDASEIELWQLKREEEWQKKITGVFHELKRILSPGGYIAFEVGEVRGGKVMLETLVVPAAIDAGLKPVLVIINDQKFTKTSNCWGVSNLKKGTNTNRIVLIQKKK